MTISDSQDTTTKNFGYHILTERSRDNIEFRSRGYWWLRIPMLLFLLLWLIPWEIGFASFCLRFPLAAKDEAMEVPMVIICIVFFLVGLGFGFVFFLTILTLRDQFGIRFGEFFYDRRWAFLVKRMRIPIQEIRYFSYEDAPSSNRGVKRFLVNTADKHQAFSGALNETQAKEIVDILNATLCEQKKQGQEKSIENGEGSFQQPPLPRFEVNTENDLHDGSPNSSGERQGSFQPVIISMHDQPQYIKPHPTGSWKLHEDVDSLTFSRRGKAWHWLDCLGMAILCLFWNGILSAFLIVVVRGLLWPGENSRAVFIGLSIFLTPFLFIGIVFWLSFFGIIFSPFCREERRFSNGMLTTCKSCLGFRRIRQQRIDDWQAMRIEATEPINATSSEDQTASPPDKLTLVLLDGENNAMGVIAGLCEYDARWLADTLLQKQKIIS